MKFSSLLFLITLTFLSFSANAQEQRDADKKIEELKSQLEGMDETVK